MRCYSVLTACLFLVLLLLSPLVTSSSRLKGHVSTTTCKTVDDVKTNVVMKQRKPDTLQMAGSGLPDCSHACGACRPCRLVMVSFICAAIEEAESCPMAYKCMCRDRAFPVP